LFVENQIASCALDATVDTPKKTQTSRFCGKWKKEPPRDVLFYANLVPAAPARPFDGAA
jgi:hypothetical protein